MTRDAAAQPVTVDDELAVRALVHRYADAVCRNDEARWASCWAPTGEWELFSRSLQGVDEIVAFYRRAMSRYDTVVQLAHNGTAEVDGDTGRGCWYISEHAFQDGTGALMLGRYDDEYVRIDGAWRFARRALTVHYAGPPDLSGPR